LIINKLKHNKKIQFIQKTILKLLTYNTLSISQKHRLILLYV